MRIGSASSFPLPAEWRCGDGDDRPRRRADERHALAVEMARKTYALAARRERLLSPDLYSNPAWLMLLDLFVSEAEGRRLSVTALCLGSRKPLATALRHVAVLCDAGLATRSADDHDGRRTFVALTEAARTRLVRLLVDDEQGSMIDARSS